MTEINHLDEVYKHLEQIAIPNEGVFRYIHIKAQLKNDVKFLKFL